MAYIYKITNQINGKVYIGKTTEPNVQERWKQHQRDRKRDKYKDRPFYRALNKYGPENFSIEEIERCDISILEEREIYWINCYRSYVGWGDCNGYNATTGGDGKAWCDYDQVYSLWQEGKLIKEIAEETGYCVESIRKILKEKGISTKEKKQRNLNLIQRKCAKIDPKTGEILEIYESTKEADRQNGNTHHIADACNGKRKICKGYKWKYLDDLIE